MAADRRRREEAGDRGRVMSSADLSASVQAYVDRELTGFDREPFDVIWSASQLRQTGRPRGRFKALRAHLPRPELSLALKFARREEAPGDAEDHSTQLSHHSLSHG